MTSTTKAMPIPYCKSSLFFAFFCLSFTRLFYHLSSFITSEDRNILRIFPYKIEVLVFLSHY